MVYPFLVLCYFSLTQGSHSVDWLWITVWRRMAFLLKEPECTCSFSLPRHTFTKDPSNTYTLNPTSSQLKWHCLYSLWSSGAKNLKTRKVLCVRIQHANPSTQQHWSETVLFKSSIKHLTDLYCMLLHWHSSSLFKAQGAATSDWPQHFKTGNSEKGGKNKTSETLSLDSRLQLALHFIRNRSCWDRRIQRSLHTA